MEVAFFKLCPAGALGGQAGSGGEGLETGSSVAAAAFLAILWDYLYIIFVNILGEDKCCLQKKKN